MFNLKLEQSNLFFSTGGTLMTGVNYKVGITAETTPPSTDVEIEKPDLTIPVFSDTSGSGGNYDRNTTKPDPNA
jgi:hypothetical protein